MPVLPALRSCPKLKPAVPGVYFGFRVLQKQARSHLWIWHAMTDDGTLQCYYRCTLPESPHHIWTYDQFALHTSSADTGQQQSSS